MCRSNRKKTKLAVKSNGPGKGAKLGWGQFSKNKNTLTKLEKANFDEEEAHA